MPDRHQMSDRELLIRIDERVESLTEKDRNKEQRLHNLEASQNRLVGKLVGGAAVMSFGVSLAVAVAARAVG